MHLQAFQTQVHCRLRTARQSFRLVPYAYAIVLPINPSRSAGKYWLAVVKWAHLVVCLASQEFAFHFREHLYVTIELLALTHAYPRFGAAGSTDHQLCFRYPSVGQEKSMVGRRELFHHGMKKLWRRSRQAIDQTYKTSSLGTTLASLKNSTTSRLNRSACSICVQCPQRPKTCSCARSMSSTKRKLLDSGTT